MFCFVFDSIDMHLGSSMTNNYYIDEQSFLEYQGRMCKLSLLAQ